jgi:hypothetical protein
MSRVLLCLLIAPGLQPDAEDYFKIRVTDDATGRGVPLVELKTVNDVCYYTDSKGVIAFHEPGLMNRPVYFHIASHGYEYPEDGFGYRGCRLTPEPGGEAELKIRRINIAERLYRVTGEGIYRDSVLLGDPVPLGNPLLNADVFGSDSVVNVVFQNRIYWFWGDTNRPSYPLGNFHVPGATSRLPEQGGLDPEQGIELRYFTADDGFAKPTARLPGEGPTWISGLVVVRDKMQRERLFARYAKIKPPLETYEQGLVEFNDQTQTFERRVQFDLDSPMVPSGHPVKHQVDGQEYVYFVEPYPAVRVRATAECLQDLSCYEAFTCLKAGRTPDAPAVDRLPDGSLRYGWKAKAPPMKWKTLQSLISDKKISADESWFQLRDVETGKPVINHGGSVYWNAYRRRWVNIALQVFGTSALGEIWYAEADSLLGPWCYARKIVSHDKYSFYNPKQHPMFDQANGRIIFFEGTYTATFSGNSETTPRYDYNQIMYRLDLSDPRLVLPIAVYRHTNRDRRSYFATRQSERWLTASAHLAFYALDRPVPDAVAIRAITSDDDASGGLEALPVHEVDASDCLFYALPADAENPPETSVLLHEFIDAQGSREYAIRREITKPGFVRHEKPLCRVWEAVAGRFRGGLPVRRID